MADHNVGPPSFSIATDSDTYTLGNAGDEAVVCQWILQFVDVSFSGTGVTVLGRPHGTAGAFVALYYIDLSNNTTATAAIAGAKLIAVPSDGMDVRLSAAVSGGSLTVYACPVLG